MKTIEEREKSIAARAKRIKALAQRIAEHEAEIDLTLLSIGYLWRRQVKA